jgi:hypothetical protein
MSEFEILQSLPEVGVTLVGFSGVVVVLGQRARGDWTRPELLGLLLLLHASFIIVLLPLVPVWLGQFDLATPEIWRISNAVLAVAHISILVWYLPFAYSVTRESDYLTPWVRVIQPPLIVLGLLIVAAETAAAFGTIAPLAAPVFSGALIFLLLIALVSFASLLFPNPEDSGDP